MQSPSTILLMIAVLSGPIVGIFSIPGANSSAEAFLDGSLADCTNFRIGQLTSLYEDVTTLGLVEVTGGVLNFFDIDLTDEGWVWVRPDEPGERFKSVTGVVTKSHMAVTDLTANHNSHDQVADILVDSEYLGLLSDVNGDHDKNGSPDSIELEWEAGIDTHTLEEGIDGASYPYFPKWAWPNIGDRVWTNGHWVFDCGHGEEKNGADHYRSEIHPSRAVASMRDQLFSLPETGTTPVRGVATDLYIHGQSGYMVAQLYCGMEIIFADDPDSCETSSTPIADNYSFNITLRAKPFDTAILATFIEDGPNNSIDIAPDLKPLPEDDPTVVQVTIPLEGSGATPDDIYARKIYAAWVAPPTGLQHHLLNLDQMELHDDKDTDPGNCECTFFFLNIGGTPENEWIRLSDFTNGMNSYDDDSFSGDGMKSFSGAEFDYYIAENMPVNFHANGMDQDCLDDWFGNHFFGINRYVACYDPLSAEVLANWGNNDGFIRANATVLGPDYECRPGSSVPPTVAGKEYTLCTSANGEIHLTMGRTFFDDTSSSVIPIHEYELYFTLDEVPLTDEDTSDLGITKTCIPGTGQSFNCTIIVENNGPGLPRNVIVQDTLTTNAPPESYTLSTPTFTIGNSYTVGPFDCDVTPPDQFECDLGTVPVGGNATITMTVTATQPGRFDDVASVTTDSEDPNSDNNEAQAAVVVVDIDIKPGEAKNTISINNDKSVRVAILGTEDFDVSTVDVSPLSDAPKFGGRTPRGPVTANLDDVNKDGVADLVMKYNEGPKNPLGFRTGDREGCIAGKLTDGTPILGCDIVRVIK